MATSVIIMAFLMGFTGSLHCAGMCGPIMWVMPFQFFNGAKKVLAVTLYHLGRVSVYAMLAVVLHSFRSFFDPRIQQYISIGLGSLLLLAGVLSFLPAAGFTGFNLPWSGTVKKLLGKFIGRPGIGAITAAGVLNGLLPCGLVYMALSATFTLGTSAQAAAFMYLFGAGTLPMLISISVLKYKASALRVAHVKKLVPVVVFCFGCLFILRGLNLGIPYISPKVVVSGHQIHSCCHKK